MEIAQVPKCMSCHKAIVVITGRALFSWLHIYYAHLASVRFEHSVCRESLMTTYVYNVCVCVRACVRVRACMRVYVRARVCVLCVYVSITICTDKILLLLSMCIIKNIEKDYMLITKRGTYFSALSAITQTV